MSGTRTGAGGPRPARPRRRPARRPPAARPPGRAGAGAAAAGGRRGAGSAGRPRVAGRRAGIAPGRGGPRRRRTACGYGYRPLMGPGAGVTGPGGPNCSSRIARDRACGVPQNGEGPEWRRKSGRGAVGRKRRPAADPSIRLVHAGLGHGRSSGRAISLPRGCRCARPPIHRAGPRSPGVYPTVRPEPGPAAGRVSRAARAAPRTPARRPARPSGWSAPRRSRCCRRPPSAPR